MVKRSAAAMFIIVVQAVSLNAADWPTVVTPLERQVVRIAMQQGDEQGSCSGSVINAAKGYILTAAHCVPEGDKGEFSMTANRRDARVVKVNRINDLAILSFKVKDEIEIAIATVTPVVGSEVAVAGFSFGSKGLAINFGHVSQLVTDDGGVWLDAMTIFGQSGGPIVDASGKLIGVNSSILSQGPAHLSQPVRVEDVRDFVDGYLPKP